MNDYTVFHTPQSSGDKMYLNSLKNIVKNYNPDYHPLPKEEYEKSLIEEQSKATRLHERRMFFHKRSKEFKGEATEGFTRNLIKQKNYAN